MLSEPRCRLAKLAGIKSKIGCKRRPGSYGRKPSVVVDYTLDRQFDLGAPNRIWVIEITCIRTLEGFAYLAVAMDLYFRRVVGWDIAKAALFLASEKARYIIGQELIVDGGMTGTVGFKPR